MGHQAPEWARTLCQFPHGHSRTTPVNDPPAPRGAGRRKQAEMAVADLASRDTTWQRCATCDLLASLPHDKATLVRGLLANNGVRYSELADELAADPDFLVDIDRQSLSRHARGLCQAREQLRRSARA